jgi:cobalt-zinc-cadmium efflux system protein
MPSADRAVSARQVRQGVAERQPPSAAAVAAHAGDAAGRARVLAVAVGITFAFALLEAIGGWWSGSLALLGDAAHMLTDSFALLLSFAAARLAALPPSSAMSYGWRRAEVIAALLNALLMVGIVAALTLAALERLQTPRPVQGGTVVLIAAIGLLVNLLVLRQLHGAHSQALNMRGALLHVIGDLLGSLAALCSGLVIWLSGWTRIDPLLSLLIAALILGSALRLLRDVLRVLMEATPAEVDLDAVRGELLDLPGVHAVHDLHVWTLAGDRLLLSAHLAVEDDQGWPRILIAAQRRLRDRFGVGHATLQPESSAYRAALKSSADEVLDDHCH